MIRREKPLNLGFAQRLKSLLKHGGQRRLAEALGVSVMTVNHWAKGVEPGRPRLIALAAALGVHPDWLLDGKTPAEIAGIRQVPVINVAACGEWLDSTDLGYPTGAASSYYPMKTDDPNAFFVIAEGDSMTGAYSKGGTIEPGDLVLVEPSRQVSDGNTVFARCPGKGCAIKKFFQREDGGVELRSINPDYRSIIIPAGEPVVVYRVVSVTKKV